MITVFLGSCVVFDICGGRGSVATRENLFPVAPKRGIMEDKKIWACHFLLWIQNQGGMAFQRKIIPTLQAKIVNHPYLQSRRRSLGRRRIAMRLIADENARVVSFSKRRSGLFKKATELSTLCGAQMTLIVLSACGRAYSFGHPNVDFVTSRYMNERPIPDLQNFANGVMLQQLKERCDEMNEELEAKKRKGKEIEEALANSPCQSLEEHASGVDATELKQLKERLEKLLDQLQQHDVNGPHSDSNERPHSVNADLSNVMNDGLGESPIPSDWLKL